MNKPVSQTKSLQAFSSCPSGLPLVDPVGIGLRAPHYQEIIDAPPKLGWLEIHPENYFCGGVHRHFLHKIRENYPLSLHGVGLSLGSDQPVDTDHLRDFKEMIDIFDPFIISDHASWSASGNAHLNDLLPLPYRAETLARVARNVDQVQEYFGRTILVENPSSYIAYKGNDMSEYEFMNALSDKTGCGILLDVNNIYVQSHNHGIDPYHYIDQIKPENVGEIHLAGHIEKNVEGGSILVDTHNQLICDEVWKLYEYSIRKLGSIPTMIEWDQDFPALDVLVGQANSTRDIILRVEGAAKGITDAAR